MNILQLIASNSFITTNKAIIKLFGLIEANIIGLFASMANFNDKNNNDGWFYITYERIEEELNISKHISSKAIEKLIKSGVLIDKKQGVPCRRFFKFQEQELFNSLKLNSLTTSSKDTQPPVVKIFNFKELNSLTTSSKDSKLPGVKKLNGYNNKDNNKDNNLPSFVSAQKDKMEDWELFFDTFWKEFIPSCDKEGNEGVKGSKKEAKRLFKSLIEQGESPVHIIWGMKAYLKRIGGKSQNCHVTTFLQQQRYEEFIEEEVKKMEILEKQNQVAIETKKEIEIFNDDAFWVGAKKELIKNIPEKWKEKAEKFSYLGKKDGAHIVRAGNKFIRDWFTREHSEIFNKIFEKWRLVAE